MSMRRDVVFAFAGVVGLAGTASAHSPFDRGERPSAGSAADRVVRADIRMHDAGDGRAETAAAARQARDHAFDNPQRERPSTMRAPEMPMLPIASSIRNRVEMRTDGDDPKSMEQRSSAAQHQQHGQGGQNTYRAPSNQAPVQIKTDIVMKCQGGDESLMDPVVRPTDAGYGHGGRAHSPEDTRSNIGDASQAELRDRRTYGHLGQDAPSPAAMFMKGSINAHRHGGGTDQSDEK